MRLSEEPVRRLSPEELGVNQPENAEDVENNTGSMILEQQIEALDSDDVILQKTKALMLDGFAGVILSGPPGTSKSWYAKRLALALAAQNSDRVRYVQFHPSYQYEDFIESYEPTDGGGFQPKPRTFLTLCDLAAQNSEELHVLVIDELSRCDAVRVFGEALTYLETSHRNVEFELASGRRVAVPPNLFIVATMNPWDRGVDDLDMALERRFAKIAMEPDADMLLQILSENGLDEVTSRRVVAFFRGLQSNSNTFVRLGHAYFARVKSVDELRRLWDHQLRFHFEKAFRQSPGELATLTSRWENIFRENTEGSMQDIPSAHSPTSDGESSSGQT